MFESTPPPLPKKSFFSYQSGAKLKPIVTCLTLILSSLIWHRMQVFFLRVQFIHSVISHLYFDFGTEIIVVFILLCA